MKCLACNECSDKNVCAVANGYEEAPYPLVSYKKKLCQKPNALESLKRKSKELKVKK